MTIRQHELEEDLFIFPAGRWQCRICLMPKIRMNVLPLSADSVILCCTPCAAQLQRALDETENPPD